MEPQTVVLNQTSDSDLTYSQAYGTMSIDYHDYEDLGKYQDGEIYDQVDEPRTPNGEINFNSCAAYASRDELGERMRATPTSGDEECKHHL